MRGALDPGRVAESLSPEGLRREQLAFAQRAFTNAQELTRFMDQKAAFLLATVGVATAALTTLVVAILRANSDAPPYLVAPTLFLVMCYLLVSFILIWTATAVFAARTNAPTMKSNSPGLLFPLILLKRHSSEHEYGTALASAGSAELLADYSNQVYEISKIYEEKQRRINLSLTLFQTLIAFWSLDLVLLALTSVL